MVLYKFSFISNVREKSWFFFLSHTHFLLFSQLSKQTQVKYLGKYLRKFFFTYNYISNIYSQISQFEIINFFIDASNFKN